MPLDERSQARILALQALCLFDALGDGFAETLDAFLRDRLNYADLGWKHGPRPKLLELAHDRVTGAWRTRATSDQYLKQYVPDWSVGRMQPVDRNILRLGLYELLECPETPPAIVINEAIELARRFGGAESPAFVNGVLDHVRRGLAAATEPVEPGPPEQES